MPNLVGTGLNQVPTNGMLGGLAYQSPDHASIKDLDLKNLSQINSEIADTAVDIFIYDTSKDSDGGAWRQRTSHTSWYNETLNTATRGSRREFPAVAVIVAETNQVTIYDGDDPDLPMWSTIAYPAHWITTPTCVTALNGIVVVGTTYSSNYGGTREINFVKDFVIIRRASTAYNYVFYSILDFRLASNAVLVTTQINSIVNHVVNDIAMTVLPNAPIDSATGLPIPTIAVATDAGASIIRDDGNVYDYTFSSQNGSKVWEITFDENYQVNMLLGYSNVYPYTCYQAPVPNADTTLTSTTNHRLLSNATFNFLQIAYKADNTPGDQIDHFIDSKYFGTTHGLSFLTPDRNNISGQMLTNITTEFNSGWMHGDIKGAFLSDTDATNVTGTELIVNGTFDSDSGWVKENGTVTISGGTLNFTNSGDNIDAYQIITTEVGKTYVATLDVTSYTSGQIRLYAYSNGSFLPGFGFRSSTGQVTHTFTAPATETRIYVYAFNTPVTLSVDNVSVRIADPDRSVNGKGLQVFGTITKSAVATGAELVAYSGFSTSNYFEQPYNSALDFGTGDFCVMGWFYYSSGIGYIWERSQPSVASGYTESYISNGTLYFHINGNAPASFSNVPTNVWCHFVCLRQSGVQSVYVNGVKGADSSSTATLTNTSAIFRVGIRAYAVATPFTGSLSLVRVSTSVPSPAQIRKIYEDEKALFQPNSQCTLYGSSDAVTALAYDEVTERLHVGTSSGRSEFQGLRRINNTTTAVTTAISTYDSFVVEQ